MRQIATDEKLVVRDTSPFLKGGLRGIYAEFGNINLVKYCQIKVKTR